MSLRTLSRSATAAVAACSLSFALAAPVLADPPPVELRDGYVGIAPRLYTAGTDVAAPDQQSPVVTSAPGAHFRPVHAQPTNGPAVAVSDAPHSAPQQLPVNRQPPAFPVRPRSLKPLNPAAPGATTFHWDDAGIGAGGALVVLLAGLGGAFAIRRRPTPDAPLAA